MASFEKLSGKDGKSAYEIWIEQGNSGTEQDFLNSLKGEKGETGDAGESTKWTTWPDKPISSTANEGDITLVTHDGGPEGGKKGDVYMFTNGVWRLQANIKGPQGEQGLKGEDGADGKDGTSVTITKVTEINVDGGSNVVTFSDGKTLTVKNGSKGSTGAKGEDGQDYVLTENDKTEIANEAISILQGGEIPEYWNGAFTEKDGKTYTKYLDEKIARVKALQSEGGKDSFSFIMITDTHYPSNLGKLSPLLAKKIMDECNIKYTLNGGDIQTRGCYQTKAEILSQNKQVAEMFAPIKDKTLQIEGNHDGSYCWSGGVVNSGTAYVKQLTEQEMFEEYYRKNGLNGNVVFDENSNAFYLDDTANKVRYIGLNSMNVPNKPTDINADGTAVYPKMHKTQFLQAQYDFLCNEALITLPSDNWSVIVFGHSGIYNAGDYAVMVDVLSAYKDKTNCVAEYEGTESGGVAYTNLAEPLPDNTTDTTKWVNGYRIGSTSLSAQAGKTSTNLIEWSVGDVIRIKGIAGFGASVDRICDTATGSNSGNYAYVSALPSDYFGYEVVDGVHTFTLLKRTNAENKYFRCCFDTPTDASSVIITKNEEIVEGGGKGYDYVSVNKDFSNAKGKFIAYFHGHEHQDKDYTRDSIKDIATRCDAQEEYEEVDRAERVKGTVTEQSFDVFTINKAKRKIYATKIGAGIDREIDY